MVSAKYRQGLTVNYGLDFDADRPDQRGAGAPPEASAAPPGSGIDQAAFEEQPTIPRILPDEELITSEQIGADQAVGSVVELPALVQRLTQPKP